MINEQENGENRKQNLAEKAKHILSRLDSIVENLVNASKEEIEQLLNHYNGAPVEVDGTTYHPYNDPVVAAKINSRYKEITGKNHPVFMREKDKVIEGLMKDKEMLVKAEAYSEDYFDKLEEIKNITSKTQQDKIEQTPEQTNGNQISESTDIINKLKQQVYDENEVDSILVEKTTEEPAKESIVEDKEI